MSKPREKAQGEVPFRVQLRIVAGSLRGRRITCHVRRDLRPTPDMVREALFNILGHAVPGRPFIDLFAGSGVVGLEALSRGAASVVFVERDGGLTSALANHAATFGVAAKVRVQRTDAYRWGAIWHPPAEPVILFLSPPFADIERQPEALLVLLEELRTKMPPDSVLVFQAESHSPLDGHEFFADWDRRRYGRNLLNLWVKESALASDAETARRDSP